MRVLERHTQELERGTQDAFMAKEKQWQAIEERLSGFTSKRHYMPMSNWSGTIVMWEREWESLAAMEDAYSRLVSDPEHQQLFSTSVIVDEQVELYLLLT